jgi:D-serine deaminase-like pyridoxal phosphate-dependent protein
MISPGRVKENIRMAISMVDDIHQLRPHVKTNKSTGACQLMMAAGINKFKCATIAEAEMLASCHAADVLFAYQPIGPKLKRFTDLVKAYPGTRFSCLIDNVDAAKEMAAFFSKENITVPVYIDLNVGMNRTGIAPGMEAIHLYNDCFNATGIQPVGLHVYDGHIRSVDFQKRKAECDEMFAAVLEMKEALTEKMLPEPIMVVGGTPTFSIHCKRKNIECSPGTFIYWDQGYQEACKEQAFLPAAVVLTRVISIPDTNKVCLDLGHKSIASEGDLARRVHFLNAPELQVISHSEEHLVAEAPMGHSFKPGDVLYGLPYHICPTVALYERAYTIEEGKLTGEWRNIARDRKISI